MTMKTTRGKVAYMLRLCNEHRTTVFLPFFDRDSLVLYWNFAATEILRHSCRLSRNFRRTFAGNEIVSPAILWMGEGVTSLAVVAYIICFCCLI